jgi:UDP-4-amino-4-deoxy-L-arabinose formyltransferase/UDP-glucuronic acid dehydrogenase (UDP-4-keto-hexauronic acid decarboxylating)
MRVLVAGEESAGAHALRLALGRGDTVVAALTSSQGSPGSVAAVAGMAGVPVLDPGLVTDRAFAAWIADHDVDLLLNVHSLRIAHGDVVEAPRLGSYNLHPGPLPCYAGLNAPSWSIYEGRRRHAVTVHRMAADVDAGPVAYEAWFDIGPDDTGLQVATRCVRLGIPLLRELLDAAARGLEHVPARPQDRANRRWFGRGAPDGGRLLWERPARRVVDHVRAADYAPFASPWGRPWTLLDDQRIEVGRARMTGAAADRPPGTVGLAAGTGVWVASADEWVAVERLRVDGTPTPPAEILRPGLRLRSGPPPG